jgi:hypothetical protein
MKRGIRRDAVLPFVGIVLGAFIAAGVGLITPWLTNWLTRTRELEKTVLDLRQKAYSDFFSAQSLYRTSDEQSPEGLKADRAIDEARLRILMTGSKGVICALTKYWARQPPAGETSPVNARGPKSKSMDVCGDVEEKKKDVAIYRAMRAEFFTSLGMKADPDLPDVVLVPYLRSCRLPGADAELDAACR